MASFPTTDFALTNQSPHTYGYYYYSGLMDDKLLPLNEKLINTIVCTAVGGGDGDLNISAYPTTACNEYTIQHKSSVDRLIVYRCDKYWTKFVWNKRYREQTTEIKEETSKKKRVISRIEGNRMGALTFGG